MAFRHWLRQNLRRAWARVSCAVCQREPCKDFSIKQNRTCTSLAVCLDVRKVFGFRGSSLPAIDVKTLQWTLLFCIFIFDLQMVSWQGQPIWARRQSKALKQGNRLLLLENSRHWLVFGKCQARRATAEHGSQWHNAEAAEPHSQFEF